MFLFLFLFSETEMESDEQGRPRKDKNASNAVGGFLEIIWTITAVLWYGS